MKRTMTFSMATDETSMTEVVTAAAPEGETLPSRWHGVMTVEGLRTTDHRRIADEALTWRQLPIALMAQFLNAGHSDAPIVGTVDTVSREIVTGRGYQFIMGGGTFDLGSEDGQNAARMVRDQILRWGSIDLEVLESRYVEIGGGGGDLLDLLFDDGGMADDWYEEVVTGRITGYTLVPMPAFPQAVVNVEGAALDIPEPMGEAQVVESGMIASAADVPETPPAGWFERPPMDTLTHLTVTEDGRVYGHLAGWGTCHVGHPNVCTVAPSSPSSYAYYRTGTVHTAEGSTIRTGVISMATGHAPLGAKAAAATSHYDNTGTAVADIAVGEDEYGIWFSGAIRHGVTDAQIRALRASDVSGDWRNIGGVLEMVGLLAVNVPGFPIPSFGESGGRASVYAGLRGDEQISLVSSAYRPHRSTVLAEIVRRLTVVERTVAPLRATAIDALAAHINA